VGGALLVFEDQSIQGPATHVLVAGIGDYPHLPGGSSNQRARFDDGMRQLSSPPASARAFADWMIGRFSNPLRPLASVDMLLGEADLSYRPPAPDGAATAEVQAELATVKAMSDAAIRWKARGDAEPGSLLVFYFCGHGISKGEDFALVASDFGGDAGRPLRGLVDVPRFLTGMSDCASTDQCYFIDACRTSSDSLVEAENWGDPLLDRLIRPTAGLAQCVYYSTLGGATAHGTKGQPSDYTAALLKALDGAGASNSEGDWRINTTRLFEAVNHLMREFADPAAPRMQVPQSGSQVTFELHRIVGEPEVPFLVGFGDHAGSTPPPSLGSVVIRQGGADVAAYPAQVPPLARPCDWRHRFFETWLASGMTELELGKAGAGTVRTNHYLQPPGMTLRGR
jgi:hypothetical protein